MSENIPAPISTKDDEISLLREISDKLDGIKKHPPLWRSLANGILIGLGTVIGATVLIGFIVSLLKPLITIPIIGEIIAQIIAAVQTHF